MPDLFSPRAHFRAFGFVVLPAVLDATDAAALAREGNLAIRDATGHRYRVDDGRGGITGHYIPATGERTPVSLALLRRFAPVVEHLVGAPMIPAVVQHALLFDFAGWHTDTGHAVPSVKIAAYVDDLDANNGALRVLPGSQLLDERVLRDVMRGPAFRDDTTVRTAVASIPAHVIASTPGDVIVFDEHIWHASINGAHRQQWSASYVLDPVTAEEELAVRAYLASEFSPNHSLDYDPTHYPHYGAALQSSCPPRWFAQLDRLGAVAAADAEQRQPAQGDRGAPLTSAPGQDLALSPTTDVQRSV